MMVVKKNITMVSVNDDVFADDVDNPMIMTMLLRSITSGLLYMKMIGADHDGDDNDEDHLDDDYFISMSMVVMIRLGKC